MPKRSIVLLALAAGCSQPASQAPTVEGDTTPQPVSKVEPAAIPSVEVKRPDPKPSPPQPVVSRFDSFLKEAESKGIRPFLADFDHEQNARWIDVLGKTRTSSSKNYVVKFRFLNYDPKKILKYTPHHDDPHKARRPRLIDNFGNIYETMRPPEYGKVPGQVAGTVSVYPYEAVEDRFVFSRLVDGVESLKLIVPPDLFGGDGDKELVFDITKKMFEQDKAEREKRRAEIERLNPQFRTPEEYVKFKAEQERKKNEAEEKERQRREEEAREEARKKAEERARKDEESAKEAARKFAEQQEASRKGKPVEKKPIELKPIPKKEEPKKE